MIIVAASLIGIVAVVACGADLRRLGLIEVRRLWLVWAAIGVQVVVLTFLGQFVHGTIGNAVHLGTYALAGWFVVSNRHVPGMVAMGSGAAMNVAAIVANGGVMPASATAWEIAGFGAKTGFNNSVPVDDPKLLFLGDVFAIPSGYPLANVFSVGDVVLVLGITWMVYRAGMPDRRRFRIPEGYVMVPRTDEHRQALLGARARLGELIVAIERQADDARRLAGPSRSLLADDSPEWQAMVATIMSTTESADESETDRSPDPVFIPFPPPTAPRQLFSSSSSDGAPV